MISSYDTFPGQAIHKSGIQPDSIYPNQVYDPSDGSAPMLISDDVPHSKESWQWNCEREMFGCFRVRVTNLEQLMYLREQHLKYHNDKERESNDNS